VSPACRDKHVFFSLKSHQTQWNRKFKNAKA
jgi:hypothetical protein